MLRGRPLRAGRGCGSCDQPGDGRGQGCSGSRGCSQEASTGHGTWGRGFSEFGFCSQLSEKPSRELGCEIYFGARSPGCWAESGSRGASMKPEGPFSYWGLGHVRARPSGARVAQDRRRKGTERDGRCGRSGWLGLACR